MEMATNFTDTQSKQRGSIPTQLPTNANNANIIDRDRLIRGKTALNHIIRGLLGKGHNLESVKNTLLHYNYIYSVYVKELTEHDLELTITSILSEKKENNLSITDEIYSYIQSTEGQFSLRDVCEMALIGNDRAAKNKTSVILGRFVKDGTIKRVGNKNGIYQKIDNELQEMDFVNAEETETKIWLPFGLDKMVKIFPGNIIAIFGEPNAGKSALCFNLIRYNMEKINVHYFNSEMGSSELKERLRHFDLPLSDWNFKAYERSVDFADCIVPGNGNLNIIDYLEITDEFWKVGTLINDIHRKMDGSITVICIQKDINKDVGRGGITTIEKPRLALAMKPGAIKIVKAKNWKGINNPNGKVIEYTLRDGCCLSSKGDWKK